MSRLGSSRWRMQVKVDLKLYCVLGTHGWEDVRGVSRRRELAEAVMRNRILPGITVPR